jgi:hypothetical protein
MATTKKFVQDAEKRDTATEGVTYPESNGEWRTFDNSKDALIYIGQKHGSTVLLGKQLKAFFPDYAPRVSPNTKNLVFAVYERGAASILQNNLNSPQADKEIAFKQAVARLTDAFIAQEAAESIIREFTTALGWQLSMPTQKRQQASSQSRKQRVEKKQPAQSQTQKQSQPQSQQQPKSTHPASAEVVTAIMQGKRRDVWLGGYQWRVLDVQSDKALLLTEDVIEKRCYNKIRTKISWEKCTLDHYLNGEFYKKFSSREQAMILETENTNASNQWFGGKGGNDTKDKVFLLSIEQVVGYFGDSGRLKNRKLKSKNKYSISDEFDTERVANYETVAWRWWLRSPGDGNRYAVYVDSNGYLNMLGYYVDDEDGGVRPALWLNLKS